MTYLVAAFVAVWLLITLYLVYVGQRQRSLEQDLQSLREMLAERGKTVKR